MLKLRESICLLWLSRRGQFNLQMAAQCPVHTEEAEVGGFQVQSKPELHNEILTGKRSKSSVWWDTGLGSGGKRIRNPRLALAT